VGTPKFNTGVHFEFVDAKTGEPISDKNVSVTISGRDADKVFDNIGRKQVEYSTNWGILDLVIDPHQVDSLSMQSDPIKFEVNVQVEGYLDVTRTIMLTETAQLSVVIALENLNNLPEGTIITEEKNIGTISELGLDETYEEEIDTTTSFLSQRRLINVSTANNIIPSITLPKGIQFFERYGRALSGSYSISYVINNFPTNGTAYSTFGVNEEGLVPKGSIYYFAQYGSVILNLYVNDKKLGRTKVWSVKNGKINMSLRLPPNFINPETKNYVKINDRIIRYTHFSYWDTDVVKKIGKYFYIQSTLGKEPFVQQYWGYTIPSSHLNYSFKYDFTKAFPGSVSLIRSTFKDNIYFGDSPSTFSVGNAPSGIYNQRIYGSPKGPVVIKFYDKNSDLIFTPQSITINNPWDNNAVYNVSVARKSGSIEWITYYINLTLISKSNNRIKIAPNTTIYLKANSKSFEPLYLRNGFGVGGLAIGVQYTMRIQLSNSSGQAKLIVESEASGCKKLTISDMTFGDNTSTDKITFYSTVDNKFVFIDYKVIVDDNILNQFK